jgi:hypothetical protein
VSARSLTHRLAKAEEALAGQRSLPEAEDDPNLIHMEDLDLTIEVLEQILAAVERLQFPDPSCTVRIDQLDLPFAVRQQILEAFEKGGWQGGEQPDDVDGAELDGRPQPTVTPDATSASTPQPVVVVPASPPPPPPTPRPVLFDVPSPLQSRRDSDRLDGVHPERRWTSR